MSRCRRKDQFDVSLTDPVRLEEVQLLTDLMAAVSGIDRDLALEELDRILGVDSGSE